MDVFKVITTISLLLLVVIVAVGQAQQQQQRSYQCGVPRVRSTFLIIHGEKAKPGQWPWHVALRLRNSPDGSETYACGGTLISRKFVLTAAHCVVGNSRKYLLRNPNEFSIWAGVFNLEKPEPTLQKRSVRRIEIKGYSRDSFLHDIALLETTEPFEYNDHVIPACLSEEAALGTGLGTLVGWGVGEDDSTSPVLKKLSMPAVDRAECLKSDPGVFAAALNRELFCAGYKNGSAPCNGDSGGGLMVQKGDAWYVTGIVSFARLRKSDSNLCLAESYTAFTNVQPYWNWIEKVTNIDFEGRFNEERDIPCQTAFGTEGKCVALQQCRDIFDIIRAPIIARDDAHYINSSICRIAGIPRAVCCRKQHIEPLPLHPNALLLPSECGRARVRSSPEDGQSTKAMEFPWVALVRFKERKNKIPHCLGTLISSRYVLSVAGCKALERKNKIDHVRLGEHSESTAIDCSPFDGRTQCAGRVLDVRVESTADHPQFNVPNLANDLSLVRLAVDVVFTDHIRPACLPLYSPGRSEIPNDQILTAWEWDRTSRNVYTGELRRYPLERFHIDECIRRYNEVLKVAPPGFSDIRMCVLQKGPERNCDRIAGATVGTYETATDGVERFVQYGVYEFSPQDCEQRLYLPIVATSLVKYLDWILSNLMPSERSIIKSAT